MGTGATVTVIPKRLQGKLKIRTLEPFRTKLRTCSAQSLNVCGTADVHVTSNQKTWTLPIVVVNAEVPPMFGRNWIQVLDETSMPALQVNAVKDAHCLEGTLAECHKLFKEELGCFKGVEVNLPLKLDAQPKFMKSQEVPYALQHLIEAQLVDMIKRDVIEPINYSEWATPTSTF